MYLLIIKGSVQYSSSKSGLQSGFNALLRESVNLTLYLTAIRLGMMDVEPVMVPSRHPELLATPFGLLMNELHRSPRTILTGVKTLLLGALAVDTGSVVDAGATDFNASTDIILYVTRLVMRVDNYASFLLDYHDGTHQCLPENITLRGVDFTPGVVEILREGREDLMKIVKE